MQNSFGTELSQNCPLGIRDSPMNGENPLTFRLTGFRRFYKLSKGMRDYRIGLYSVIKCCEARKYGLLLMCYFRIVLQFAVPNCPKTVHGTDYRSPSKNSEISALKILLSATSSLTLIFILFVSSFA